MAGASVFVNGKDMQIRIPHANTIFHIFRYAAKLL